MKIWGLALFIVSYTAHWMDVCMPASEEGTPLFTVEHIGQTCAYARQGTENFDDKWDATKFLANCSDCTDHSFDAGDETAICCDHKALKEAP